MNNLSKRKQIVRMAIAMALCCLILLVLPILNGSQPNTTQLYSTPSVTFSGTMTPTHPPLPLLNSYALSLAENLLKAPQPTPFWLYRVEPHPGYQGAFPSTAHFTVSLNTDWLWEANDTRDRLWKKLPNRFDVMVNGQYLPLTASMFGEYGGFLYIGEGYGMYDEFGKFIDSGMGAAETYYLLNLPTGIYLAKVTIRMNTGELYSYTWAFNITSDSQEEYNEVLRQTQSVIEAQSTILSIMRRLDLAGNYYENRRQSARATESAQRSYFVATFGAGRKTIEASRR